MSELVRQLRRQSTRISRAPYYAEVGALLTQAADEIERLNAAIASQPAGPTVIQVPAEIDAAESTSPRKRVSSLRAMKIGDTVEPTHRALLRRGIMVDGHPGYGVITDVPDDAGGCVRVRWDRPKYPDMPAEFINRYWIKPARKNMQRPHPLLGKYVQKPSN